MGVRGSLTLTPVPWTRPSNQVASPSLGMRVCACSYCILLSLWLMPLGGLLFSGRRQRKGSGSGRRGGVYWGRGDREGVDVMYE